MADSEYENGRKWTNEVCVMEKYTDYCTTFFDTESSTVYFWDEIKNRALGKQKVKDKVEADHVMKTYKGNAPDGVICDVIN